MEEPLTRYIDLGGWNQQVESLTTLNRIRTNTFLARLRLKKSGFASYPREAVISITYIRDCPCLSSDNASPPSQQHHKHFLVLQSMPSQAPSAGYVSMNFHQTIEVSQIEPDS